MQTRLVFFGLLAHFAAAGQSFTETISKELSFEKKSPANTLVIANMNGGIQVMSYEGSNVMVEVKKSVSAKTEPRLATGKSEVQLGVIDRADTIILYVADGCHQFARNGRGRNHSGWGDGGWNYQSDRGCNLLYDYKMDFTVKVPASLNLVVSTINDGNVVVENVSGVVKAGNINGSIRLSRLQSETVANTINGDVDIEYALNPRKECRFYSLNGDINASFQPGLSANLSFDSFNGDFYTNLTRLETLPAEVQKSERGEGVKYKISGNQYKVGSGGPLLDFETFNGNVYLKEKSN